MEAANSGRAVLVSDLNESIEVDRGRCPLPRSSIDVCGGAERTQAANALSWNLVGRVGFEPTT
jgi:hypothetical protein